MCTRHKFVYDGAVGMIPSQIARTGRSFAERKSLVMQIQVNTDNQVHGTAELIRHVESVVDGTFSRFGEQITRVELHLSDENSSHKSGDNDKRCVMEARLSGLQPITVNSQGSSIEQALSGAADKLEKVLDRTLGRLDDRKGRTSFAGDQEC